MAASQAAQDRSRLYKFTKVLTLKVAQIVVQSRQGKKITQEFNANKLPGKEMTISPSVQWFNLSIPDEPEVNSDAKRVLNGEVVSALSNILCIEISLKTTDGDEMVLELWTVRMLPGCDPTMTSVSTLYYRMSIMLKSTLSISRITPAYKMSRLQSRENYKIYHKIYGGSPEPGLLGENCKAIKVSELRTPIGTINIEVLYRTKMAILPDAKRKALFHESISNSEDIMLVSNHFPRDSPRKGLKRDDNMKGIDLSKPLTAGAFVDTESLKELHDTLNLQLPPEPPMSWLIAEQDNIDRRLERECPDETNLPKAGSSQSQVVSQSTPRVASKAIEVPKARDDKYISLMEFPFAEGSPITELATFYQECLQARSATEQWADVLGELGAAPPDEPLAEQLRKFEEAVPEFDDMVASMFTNTNSDNTSHF